MPWEHFIDYILSQTGCISQRSVSKNLINVKECQCWFKESLFEVCCLEWVVDREGSLTMEWWVLITIKFNRIGSTFGNHIWVDHMSTLGVIFSWKSPICYVVTQLCTRLKLIKIVWIVTFIQFWNCMNCKIHTIVKLYELVSWGFQMIIEFTDEWFVY